MQFRGGVVIAVLIAALAAPIAAAAPISTFKGTVTGDENSKLTFKVVKNKKGKRRVDYPKSKLVNATCEAGPEEIDTLFGSLRNAKVSKTGEFEFDNSGEGYVAYVKGVIIGNAASGELRFQGPTDFDGTEQDCDTGAVKWTAKKV